MTIRMTSARKAILEELESSKAHLTINQIHERLFDRLPSLNISTVYRSLDFLFQNGLISMSDMGIGTPVYEIMNEESHHHLVCSTCQHVIELEDELVAPFFDKIEKMKNIKVFTNHLVIFGQCTDCKDQ